MLPANRHGNFSVVPDLTDIASLRLAAKDGRIHAVVPVVVDAVTEKASKDGKPFLEIQLVDARDRPWRQGVARRCRSNQAQRLKLPCRLTGSKRADVLKSIQLIDRRLPGLPENRS